MVDRAIYIGYNGAVSQQTGIDVLGHNIANINTVGYRAQRPTFADLFNRTDRIATEIANPVQTGHGVDISSIDTMHRQGEVKASTAFSDVAIVGEGFFVLRDPRLAEPLNTFYTRAGHFVFDAGVADSTSGDPFTDGGRVLFLRDFPTYTTKPRLVDPSTGWVVRGYLADESDGTIQTSVTDLTIDPRAVDKANETKAYSIGGSLNANVPDYNLTVMKDGSSTQLESLIGKFNENQDRGILKVAWNADGSGTWTFLKVGQTIPDAQNFVNFDANMVQKNKVHDFIPGVAFRTQDVSTLRAGSFTGLVGPFSIQSNSSSVSSVEGAYLGNREDGTLTINTAASGAVTWSFVPDGKSFISESGSGTFAAADSATASIIPGITIRKTAGTALTGGTVILKTDHESDAAAAIGGLFDDSSPTTQHTMITTFKHIGQNDYGYMVSGFTQETFSDSGIATITSGQKQIKAYANIDPNQITMKRASDNATMGMASSQVIADSGGNIRKESVRGGFWTSTIDQSGNVSLTVNADGSGSWSFTPVGQVQATANGTIAAGTLKADTTYGIHTGNEVIPGMIFKTGSSIAAGIATFETTIGHYNVSDNLITFSPSFSNKINTSTTKFLVDYKFASDRFTDASATSGTTNLYSGKAAFDANRQFDTTNSSVPNVTFTPNSSLNALTITPTLTNLAQVAGQPEPIVEAVDGNIQGDLLQLEIAENGLVIGRFSNLRQKNMAQFVLATFRNPGGLSRVGDTAFIETAASAAPVVQSIDQMPAGLSRLSPFKLEYSNSKLDDELTDLIFFQRAFQFSSRAIRAADELIQNAIGLKRG